MQGLTVFRSRFFWKLFLSLSAVLLVTAVFVNALVSERLANALSTSLEEALRDQALLMGPYVEHELAGSGAPGRLQAELAPLAADSRVRATVILPDGRVLADSDEDPVNMENHGSRPEVLAAREEPFGVSRRLSRTVGYSMLYVARAIERDGELLGTLRLSLPLRDIDEQVAAARRSILVASGIGLAIALALGVFLARRTSIPILAMTRTAQAMRRGDYDARVAVPTSGEVGMLAGTLDQLGAELAGTFATISQDDAQLRAMLAGMVEGVVAVDEDDRVMFCNGAAEGLLGIRGSATGQKIWGEAPIAALQELIEGARRTDAATEGELELYRGKERVIQAHASPFQGGGRSGVVVVVHDVTELRRLEQIRRDFVANVSHELKTPLTAIKGFVETLRAGAAEDPELTERYLRRIDVNVDRLTHLVGDLLSLARIESHQDAIKGTRQSWREIVDGVLRRRADSAQRKGVRLDLHDADPSVIVVGDAEAMTQVVENLVDNAIKYTAAPGEVWFGIEARDGHGVLTVRDTGMGIPLAEQERVFERFYRVDKGRSREVGGTGLGLSIVKHLMLAMGGDVRLESEPGMGSSFSVALPLV